MGNISVQPPVLMQIFKLQDTTRELYENLDKYLKDSRLASVGLDENDYGGDDIPSGIVRRQRQEKNPLPPLSFKTRYAANAPP